MEVFVPDTYRATFVDICGKFAAVVFAMTSVPVTAVLTVPLLPDIVPTSGIATSQLIISHNQLIVQFLRSS